MRDADREAMAQYYVYILASDSRRLYTGVTSDLVRRVWEHRQGLKSRFASRYHISRLVYYEITEDIKTAIGREKQIKNWRRAKRIALIDRTNAGWLDLAAEWFRPEAHFGARREDSSLRSE
jgi:putative endonuclease